MINAFIVRAALVLAQEVPDGPARPPGPLGQKMNDLVGYTKYVGFGLCVIGLIAAGGMMALAHRRGEVGVESAGGVLKVLVGVAVISGAAGLVGLFV